MQKRKEPSERERRNAELMMSNIDEAIFWSGEKALHARTERNTKRWVNLRKALKHFRKTGYEHKRG